MIYTLNALQKEYQRGKTYRYLFFWGYHPAADGTIGASCLSQWWSQDFKIDGISYCCAEQYMMAEKARLFGDIAMLEKIMCARSPKEMKAYGRMVQRFDDEIWSANAYDIVRRASAAKFGQNPELLRFLISTGNRILVEASPYDRIWGIGMDRKSPDASNPMKWRGTNLLGFALTQTRNELLKRDEAK